MIDYLKTHRHADRAGLSDVAGAVLEAVQNRETGGRKKVDPSLAMQAMRGRMNNR